jgi:uncharacterized protein involved in outer membrane biogenesis
MGGSLNRARTKRRFAWIGVPAALVVLLAIGWQWDWFIPFLQNSVSAATGRTTKIGHLHLGLGRTIEITADDVMIANPSGWPKDDPPLASIETLTVQANLWDYIRGRGLVLPRIVIKRPHIYAAETPNGAANFQLSTGGNTASAPKVGDLRIVDGEVHAVMPRLRADFQTKIFTTGEGDNAALVVDSLGTYAAQPIRAHLVGGALLSLRDPAHPWPVDLTLDNGPTHVALKGTLQDPLALKDANVTLQVSGPDMSLLEHLAGFPIPKTPSYQISGKLDFEGLEKIRFDDFRGQVGSSDIAGTVTEQPSGTVTDGKPKPVVTMDVRSNRVDLADLKGVIGGEPGRIGAVNETPGQRAKLAQANANPKLLPNTPIDVPRLNWADVHLHYHGTHIVGRYVPLDDVTVAMDIVGGRIAVHPVSFGIGKGRLLANVDLMPQSDKQVHAKADLRMQSLDVSRLMAATHSFHGAGSVSGVGTIDAYGDSLASLMANGNGGVKMAMAGGDISALLVDLSGLQFGNALLAALGIPQKTPIQCFVTDLGLRRGILEFNAMVLDTTEGLTDVGGNIDLRSETIDLALKTAAKHFSIGSLPTQIAITGTFKNPTIRPGVEVAARTGAVAGLAILFAPLAILPTIQFGTSAEEDARCGELLVKARASAAGKALPSPPQQNPDLHKDAPSRR